MRLLKGQGTEQTLLYEAGGTDGLGMIRKDRMVVETQFGCFIFLDHIPGKKGK